MQKIRIMAVESDPLQANVLRTFLDRLGYEGVEMVRSLTDMQRGLQENPPDLLFMDSDIQEGQTTIEQVRQNDDLASLPVIYLTSFSEKRRMEENTPTAPEAYVLKPIDPLDLQQAIEQAFQRQLGSQRADGTPIQLAYVFVKDKDRLVKVKTEDIVFVEAYDKSSFVHTRSAKYMLDVPLRLLIEHLPAEQFARVHRAYLVNMGAVDSISPGQDTVEIAGKRLPISKTHKNTFVARLKDS